MAKNNLKEILIKQGISQSELVKSSGLSVATIANCYHNKGNLSQVTRSKIVNGVNKLLEKEAYTLLSIFPE